MTIYRLHIKFTFVWPQFTIYPLNLMFYLIKSDFSIDLYRNLYIHIMLICVLALYITMNYSLMDFIVITHLALSYKIYLAYLTFNVVIFYKLTKIIILETLNRKKPVVRTSRLLMKLMKIINLQKRRQKLPKWLWKYMIWKEKDKICSDNLFSMAQCT